MSEKRVLIAASGTGGHLMPALHIMKSLAKGGVAVSFVGTGRPLEEQIVGSAGFPCSVIPTVGLKNRGIGGLLEFLISIPQAIAATCSTFRKIRPDVVVGVGGYATFYPIVYAWLTGVPRLIHESEHKPGLANRVLSYFASRITLAFESTAFPQAQKKTLFTGQPVRAELFQIAGQSKHVDRPHKLLVLGGSQGADALDQAMMRITPFCKKHLLHVWHQCRKENVEAVKERYHELEVHHRVVPFIEDMPEAYRWADIIVSRSGAGAVMEIGLVNRPTIFVPLPTAQGDHQTKNAHLLVDQGKAYLVKQNESLDEGLMRHLEKVLDPDQYNRMRLRAARGRPTDASQLIADEVLRLANE